MIVAVTGTPGTGKTTIACELSERLDQEYVDLDRFANQDAVDTLEDEARDSVAVDTGNLAKVVEEEVREDVVLDGHFAHRMEADVVVVLRCAPDELRNRLAEKGWEEPKIAENVEAERMDLILQQAVPEQDTVLEVDTTGCEAEDVASEIAVAVRNDEFDKYQPGTVSWEIVPEGKDGSTT